jgi:hypothetical protein|tara:strand:+ start:879 stop:1175 length:297 start_codon:yes stop_codon:yes gene_type:complete
MPRVSYDFRQSQPHYRTKSVTSKNAPSTSKAQINQDVEDFLRRGGKIKQIPASDGGERAIKHMWHGQKTRDQKDREKGQTNRIKSRCLHYYGKPTPKY